VIPVDVPGAPEDWLKLDTEKKDLLTEKTFKEIIDCQYQNNLPCIISMRHGRYWQAIYAPPFAQLLEQIFLIPTEDDPLFPIHWYALVKGSRLRHIATSEEGLTADLIELFKACTDCNYFSVHRGEVFCKAAFSPGVKEPFYFLEYAAFYQSTNAMCILGDFYQEKKNHQLAADWHGRAARLGSLDGQYKLACHYYYGFGVEKSAETAFMWFRQAALEGSAPGQYQLALCYEEGKGIEPDLVEAAYWYRQAADKGHVLAIYNLALCYEEGKGVKKDLCEALYYYKRGAINRCSQSAFRLATFYQLGKEKVAKDPEKADYWFRQAADLGYHTEVMGSSPGLDSGIIT